MKFFKQRPWVWIGILLVVLVGGFFIWKSRSGDHVTIKEFKVEKGDLNLTILSTGSVAPENRLDIKPPVAGRVDQVLVDEGDKIKKGQILAWMSSTERAALIDAARTHGPEEVKHWEELYRPTPIIAPIAGTLILRSVESGQTVAATDAVLTMSDRLTVKAQVDETDIAQVHLKQKAEIVLDAYAAQKISAKVDQIAFDAKTVNNVTTYVVDVLPDETPEFMRSGMTANVTFFGEGKKDILLIPTEALKIRDGKVRVTVKTGDNPEKDHEDREIEVGTSDGKRSEVVSGLQEGDTVLLIIKAKEANKSSNPFSPFSSRPRTPGAGGGNRH